MLRLTIHAIVSAALFFFAQNALRRGWLFARVGWLALSTHAGPGASRWVERRRMVSDGGRFFIGGLLWLGAGGVSLAGALVLGWSVFAELYLGG